MGVPTSEVGYTPAMSRREDHEVHEGHGDIGRKKIILYYFISYIFSSNLKVWGPHFAALGAVCGPAWSTVFLKRVG